MCMYLAIIGKNGVKLRMSECISDMHGYWKLQEYLLRQIEFSWSEVLHHITIHNMRDMLWILLTYVGTSSIKRDHQQTEKTSVLSFCWWEITISWSESEKPSSRDSRRNCEYSTGICWWGHCPRWSCYDSTSEDRVWRQPRCEPSRGVYRVLCTYQRSPWWLHCHHWIHSWKCSLRYDVCLTIVIKIRHLLRFFYSIVL